MCKITLNVQGKMIPKKIHYIWLGKGKKDRVSQICINSWYSNLKDYEIIEWNEDNLPLEEIAKNNKFFQYCKKNKLWAFMSDYLRVWILYREGGIYLDTDVQSLKPFDPLLHNSMFIGYESGNYIGTGIIGCEKGNQYIHKVMEFYNKKIWEVPYYQNPIIFSSILKENPQLIDHCTILKRTLLSPYNPVKDYKDETVQSNDTYTIHWFNANWGMSRKGYVFLNTKQYYGIRKITEIIRKNIGYEIRKVGIKSF